MYSETPLSSSEDLWVTGKLTQNKDIDQRSPGKCFPVPKIIIAEDHHPNIGKPPARNLWDPMGRHRWKTGDHLRSSAITDKTLGQNQVLAPYYPEFSAVTEFAVSFVYLLLQNAYQFDFAPRKISKFEAGF